MTNYYSIHNNRNIASVSNGNSVNKPLFSGLVASRGGLSSAVLLLWLSRRNHFETLLVRYFDHDTNINANDINSNGNFIDDKYDNTGSGNNNTDDGIDYHIINMKESDDDDNDNYDNGSNNNDNDNNNTFNKLSKNYTIGKEAVISSCGEKYYHTINPSIYIQNNIIRLIGGMQHFEGSPFIHSCNIQSIHRRQFAGFLHESYLVSPLHKIAHSLLSYYHYHCIFHNDTVTPPESTTTATTTIKTTCKECTDTTKHRHDIRYDVNEITRMSDIMKIGSTYKNNNILLDRIEYRHWCLLLDMMTEASQYHTTTLYLTFSMFRHCFYNPIQQLISDDEILKETLDTLFPYCGERNSIEFYIALPLPWVSEKKTKGATTTTTTATETIPGIQYDTKVSYFHCIVPMMTRDTTTMLTYTLSIYQEYENILEHMESEIEFDTIVSSSSSSSPMILCYEDIKNAPHLPLKMNFNFFSDLSTMLQYAGPTTRDIVYRLCDENGVSYHTHDGRCET
jgi:hypothetical protein